MNFMKIGILFQHSWVVRFSSWTWIRGSFWFICLKFCSFKSVLPVDFLRFNRTNNELIRLEFFSVLCIPAKALSLVANSGVDKARGAQIEPTSALCEFSLANTNKIVSRYPTARRCSEKNRYPEV